MGQFVNKSRKTKEGSEWKEMKFSTKGEEIVMVENKELYGGTNPTSKPFWLLYTKWRKGFWKWIGEWFDETHLWIGSSLPLKIVGCVQVHLTCFKGWDCCMYLYGHQSHHLWISQSIHVHFKMMIYYYWYLNWYSL